MSVQDKYRVLENAFPEMLEGIGALIQKAKISNRFESVRLSGEELQLLEKAKELSEVAILERWEDKNDDFKAMCSTHFDIASQLPIDMNEEYLFYEYIKLISCAYLGENWHMARQFIKQKLGELTSIEPNGNWNIRLMQKSFLALVYLVKKDNWEDVDHAVKTIEELRGEQEDFEFSFLSEQSDNSKPLASAELVSLYHFAKSVELVGKYVLNGRPTEVETQLNYHLNYSKEYASLSHNITLELLLQFFEALATKLIRNTIWYSTRGINSRVSAFNNHISERADQGIFELLYPQREAILEGELLNPAHNAIVVNLPTSSGKTMIAEYRILMALNQFAAEGGWVAYVVPTRALVNQIYIDLKRDLGPIGVKVEKVSGALDLDGFEEALLEKDLENPQQPQFDVLVTTYEKLHLMIRQGYGVQEQRPLVLAVVDEAHNIEDEHRGLNLELLLTTIKNDCEKGNFLLMTPDIINSDEIANWLGGDRGKKIQLSLHWWQPNERVIGALLAEGSRRKYDIKLKTLLSNKGTFKVDEDIMLAEIEEGPMPISQFYGGNGNKKKFSSLIAAEILDIKEPSVILARNPGDTFDIAQILCENSTNEFEEDAEVELVRRFIQDELGEDFPLVELLKKRIAVHSSVLPDEIKLLIEDLMGKGKLQALVATTTIAQGINFPISSVIMSTHFYPFGKEMPVRDFWNLAGRVGRAGQSSLGWVGFALKNDDERSKIAEYVKKAADHLKSQLARMVEVALSRPDIPFENWLFYDAKWSGLLQYISHLHKQSEDLSILISQLEQKLQSTFGYSGLNEAQKNYLRENVREYARNINPRDAALADETGFSTVSLRRLMGKLRDANLNGDDWRSDQLFSEQNQSMKKLVDMMLDTPEVQKAMEDAAPGGDPTDMTSLSRLIIDWVNGQDISYLADKYFSNLDQAKAIEKCSKALYRNIAHAATWGIAAMQKMSESGIDWDSLSETDIRKLQNLPAMIHYGVNTDEAVLMRKNSVPRSIATRLGELYNAEFGGEIFNQNTNDITNWIRKLDNETWEEVRPSNSVLSGSDYRKVWHKLTGVEE